MARGDEWILPVGQTVDGRFELLELAGRGPTGIVYRARDRALGSDVAFKLLHPAVAAAPHRETNLFRLYRARAMFHETIVPVSDVIVRDDILCVVEPYVHAPTLRAFVEARRAEMRPLTRPEIATLVVQICRALQRVHLIGPHGNLKPENVFVVGNEARVADPFLLLGRADVPKEYGSFPLRDHYMAPELLRDARDERRESDVYSLGLVVGELIVGAPVRPAIALSEQGPLFSDPLDRLFLRATADHPGERFASVAFFWEALRTAIGAEDIALESRAGIAALRQPEKYGTRPVEAAPPLAAAVREAVAVSTPTPARTVPPSGPVEIGPTGEVVWEEADEEFEIEDEEGRVLAEKVLTGDGKPFELADVGTVADFEVDEDPTIQMDTSPAGGDDVFVAELDAAVLRARADGPRTPESGRLSELMQAFPDLEIEDLLEAFPDLGDQPTVERAAVSLTDEDLVPEQRLRTLQLAAIARREAAPPRQSADGVAAEVRSIDVRLVEDVAGPRPRPPVATFESGEIISEEVLEEVAPQRPRAPLHTLQLTDADIGEVYEAIAAGIPRAPLETMELSDADIGEVLDAVAAASARARGGTLAPPPPPAEAVLEETSELSIFEDVLDDRELALPQTGLFPASVARSIVAPPPAVPIVEVYTASSEESATRQMPAVDADFGGPAAGRSQFVMPPVDDALLDDEDLTLTSEGVKPARATEDRPTRHIPVMTEDEAPSGDRATRLVPVTVEEVAPSRPEPPAAAPAPGEDPLAAFLAQVGTRSEPSGDEPLIRFDGDGPPAVSSASSTPTAAETAAERESSRKKGKGRKGEKGGKAPVAAATPSAPPRAEVRPAPEPAPTRAATPIIAPPSAAPASAPPSAAVRRPVAAASAPRRGTSPWLVGAVVVLLAAAAVAVVLWMRDRGASTPASPPAPVAAVPVTPPPEPVAIAPAVDVAPPPVPVAAAPVDAGAQPDAVAAVAPAADVVALAEVAAEAAVDVLAVPEVGMIAAAPDVSVAPDVQAVAAAPDVTAPAPDVAVAAAAPDTGAVAVAPAPTVKLSQLQCPGGMARIAVAASAADKEAGHATVEGKWAYCIDRFEAPGKGSIPRANVSWFEANQACKAAGKRLCTNREWQRACGGTYPYGSTYDPKRCNTVGDDGLERPVVPSGNFAGCKSGLGIYDMSGNVSEWTANRMVAGGSAERDGDTARCNRISRRFESSKSQYVGYRCCADPVVK